MVLSGEDDVPAPASDPFAASTYMDDVLDAFSWIVKAFETLPAAAVSVALCAGLHADTFAAKLAVVMFPSTVTDAGAVTFPLLLDRFTFKPPAGAGWLNLMVQASVPDPVIEALAQESELSAANGCAVALIEKVFETIPALAVMVAVVDLVTAEMAAVKPIVECPDDTVTVDGTVTAELLLDRFTSTLLPVSADRYTEQESVAAPV